MSDAPDPSELARRYLDLWQQHLLQAANDPDLSASLAKMAEMMPGMPGVTWPPTQGTPHDGTAKGTASAAGASGSSDDDIGELRRRLAAAEKRLDALEGKSRGTRKRAAKASGRRKS